MATMTMESRIALFNRLAEMPTGSVTLDGRPAIIAGMLAPFATVSTLGRPFASAQFSWQAVERIAVKGGQFQT